MRSTTDRKITHKPVRWTRAGAVVTLRSVERILAKALGQDATPAAVAEKRDLLERLLARLAHEIRNPLSSLDVHLQLLEEDLGTLAPAMREQLTPRLEIIHGELHRLENVVDRFLKVTGPSALDLEMVELVKVVTHVCELLRPEAAARQIEIATAADPSLKPLRADPVRLTQALMNLVINAMQAVERKGRISVATAAADTSQLITVHDSGPGIPAERLSSIFDPYFTTKPEGIGLGLWIAQQIVTAHGGTLKAQNAPEGGAVFTIVLPTDRSIGVTA
jgi:two-component system sensor histidine kinase HydH